MSTSNQTPLKLWLAMTELVMDHKNLWRETFESRLEVPFSRYRAMRRLERRALTQRDLADLLHVDAPAASVIVTDLVDRGLVTRRPHPEDGRAKIVEITDSGRDWMEEVRSLPVAVPAAVDVLSAAERRDLARLLAKMRDAGTA
ncbi:MarR family transcriptional regulator [Nocardioides carbamazepini]|uniref:MarR family winged helix-turn-helix transcriptional regulator n=1 Tax=Nocardioides carbamazepini TaxID=2854259 RepID=UPI00214A7419|nr:MarR family transcriptional regulator [Nocardioides carbamazepini]MCR1783894.1 MarR family transcriptional regulator [Nocardioides carbamazepini]